MEIKVGGNTEKSAEAYLTLLDQIKDIRNDDDATLAMRDINEAQKLGDISAAEAGELYGMAMDAADARKKSRNIIGRKEVEALELVFEMLADKVSDRQKQKDLFSAEDLADRYGVSASAMRTRIRQGDFGDVVKIGDHSLVPYASVLKYEAEHTGPAYKQQERKSRRKRLAGEI